jgi:hypothetical protein
VTQATDTTDAAPTVPVWHHPHFISATEDSIAFRFEFRPFTGDEPEPKIPDHIEAAFHAAWKAHPWDSEIGRAVRAASRDAEREERVANTLWQVARYNRRYIGLLQQVAPLVAAFQAAKQRAVDTYESLHATPDGFWQAKLLTLTEQRTAALEAARKLDEQSGELTNTYDGLPERVLEALPYPADLEKAAGVDFGDWYPQESYGYGDGPDVKALKALFAGQDKRIAEVTRLFAAGERR